MRTRAEVEQLKQNWLKDPCWDLSTTGGFEEYSKELKKFEREQKRESDKLFKDRVQQFAFHLGIGDNLKLAKFVLDLVTEIESLKNSKK